MPARRFSRPRGMTYSFRPAKRSEAKPLIGLYAESGAGKTYSALLLARGFNDYAGMIDAMRARAQHQRPLNVARGVRDVAPASIVRLDVAGIDANVMRRSRLIAPPSSGWRPATGWDSCACAHHRPQQCAWRARR
jgi:hypothetical protein